MNSVRIINAIKISVILSNINTSLIMCHDANILMYTVSLYQTFIYLFFYKTEEVYSFGCIDIGFNIPLTKITYVNTIIILHIILIKIIYLINSSIRELKYDTVSNHSALNLNKFTITDKYTKNKYFI